MNVKQEGLGLGPAPHLPDAGGVIASQVEGHGSASAEGVAADIGVREAEAVETGLTGGQFDCFVGVVGGDLSPRSVHGTVDTEDGCLGCATVGQDLVHSAGQGSDWGELSACAVLGDGLALRADFGAGDLNGGAGGSAQGGEGGVVGNCSSISSPECDVLDGEGVGLLPSSVSGFGVFSNAEKVIKGNVGEVSNSLCEGCSLGGVGVGLGVPEEPVDDSDGDSEFGLHLWVFVDEAPDKSAQPGPSGFGVWVGEGAGSFVQVEGRGDGAQRCLN